MLPSPSNVVYFPGCGSRVLGKKGVYVSARVVRQQISVGRASAGCGSSPGHHHTFFSLLSLLSIQLEI